MTSDNKDCFDQTWWFDEEKSVLIMKIFSFIFLLGLAGCAMCQICPPPEKTLPCECVIEEILKDVLIVCKDNTMTLEDLKQVLRRMSDERDIRLVLKGLNLGSVPSDFFNGSSIEYIYIINCMLESLADGIGEPALVGLEKSLKVLLIIHSFMKENVTARLNVKHLQKLKTLQWTKNKILEMGNDWFDNVPTFLEHIAVGDNGIKTLGDKVFANLPNLKSVYLAENSVNYIQRSMFPFPANKLEMIHLEKIHVSIIPEDIFSNMSSLKDVTLYGMNISRLEENFWKPIWNNLEFISLEENPLECDSHMNWIVDYNIPEKMYGTCSYPDERNGMSLLDYIYSMQQ